MKGKTVFLIVFALVIFMIRTTASAEPVITSVLPSQILNEGQGGVDIHGTGFSNNPTVYLTKNNNWNDPVQIVEQVDISLKTDTQIRFVVNTCGINYWPLLITQAGDAYLWVVDDTGTPTASGLLVHLDSVKDNSPPAPSNFQDGNSSPEIFPHGGHLNSGLDEAYPVLPLTFDIQSKFYENEQNDPVLCEYSIDGGQNWTSLPSSTPMSTGAVYCIKNYVTAPEGPVAIKMRAYSTCGGWGETITKNREVDGSGPDSGRLFSVTEANGECSLTWDETTDSGIGMHETEPYEIRYGRDLAPAGCNYGGSIYNGLFPQSPVVHSGLNTGHNYYYLLCYKDDYGYTSSFSGGPVECIVPGILLSAGVLNTISWVDASSGDFGVNAFRMKTNTGSTTVTELVLLGFDVSSVDTVKVFKDNGTTPNSFDAGDTFIASGTFTGTDLTLSGLNISVTNTAEQYIVTMSTVASPLEGETMSVRVMSAIGDLPVTGADGGGAYITVDTTPPTTTDNAPSGWQNSEVTITLTANDNGGSGVDQASGIYGCLGSGCTPVFLGGKTMTTSCGADNECIYDVRYYSVDMLGHAEPVKTAANQVKVDRKPPTAGTFTAQGGINPIALSWSGFSDSGSQFWSSDRYSISRLSGSTPLPDCSSYRIYTGSGESYSDGSVVDGQQYAYTLCAKDGAGNVTTLTATATADTCITETMCWTCHTSPPSGGHVFHGMPCSECHETQLDAGMPNNDPSHTDGMIRLRADKTAYSGGDQIPYPGTGAPLSCGGYIGPIGGIENSQPPQNPPLTLPCHWGANWGGPAPMPNPDITPFWECIWDESRTCNDVGAGGPDLTDCNSCHGIPVGMGMTGGDYFPGAHDIHNGIDCMVCHQESGPDPVHLGGMINLTFETAWNGPNPQPWPDPVPKTCGGGMYIGGDPMGGAMACHMGSPMNPILEPSWECVWDVIRNCWDPTQMGP